MAVGRRPYTKNLGLEELGINLDNVTTALPVPYFEKAICFICFFMRRFCLLRELRGMETAQHLRQILSVTAGVRGVTMCNCAEGACCGKRADASA